MAASRNRFRFVLEATRRLDRIAELAKAGHTAAEIAAEVGICRNNVYRALLRVPDAPRLATKARRAKQAEDAERMARWREEWARKKAEREAPPAMPRMDEAALGDATRRLAASEQARRQA
ncbi:hypothetical protein [Rubellimicrobium arenae]|uniref:hypothetical protein n=1 Tax=Rubellimicrobium arenae TaxID=2817372 RepID=UPI001B306E43|nr:hypothetical protein [Rubellimicrobium arenae]